MSDPNCSRCGGSGSYEMSGDLHKSAGIVPCDCQEPSSHWLTTLLASVPGGRRDPKLYTAIRKARDVERLVEELRSGPVSTQRLNLLAEMILDKEDR